MTRLNKNCATCGQKFESVFEASDHELKGDDATFDPVLLLPGRESIKVGTLLRKIFAVADDEVVVRGLIEEVYELLWLSEYFPEDVHDVYFDLVKAEHTHS